MSPVLNGWLEKYKYMWIRRNRGLILQLLIGQNCYYSQQENFKLCKKITHLDSLIVLAWLGLLFYCAVYSPGFWSTMDCLRRKFSFTGADCRVCYAILQEQQPVFFISRKSAIWLDYIPYTLWQQLHSFSRNHWRKTLIWLAHFMAETMACHNSLKKLILGFFYPITLLQVFK